MEINCHLARIFSRPLPSLTLSPVLRTGIQHSPLLVPPQMSRASVTQMILVGFILHRRINMTRTHPENMSIRAGWPNNMVWFIVFRYYIVILLQLQECFFELLFILLKSGDGEIVHYCWENIVRVNFPFTSIPSRWGLTSVLWSPNQPLKTPENVSLLKEWFQFVDL